jgi:hypothetical protein
VSFEIQINIQEVTSTPHGNQVNRATTEVLRVNATAGNIDGALLIAIRHLNVHLNPSLKVQEASRG